MGFIDQAINGLRRAKGFVGGDAGAAAPGAATPLPEIQPELAQQAQPSIRATPAAPEQLRPIGPSQSTATTGAGDGFVYGRAAAADRIPNNPNIAPGGMSPEAAAFQAENAARMGPAEPSLRAPQLDIGGAKGAFGAAGVGLGGALQAKQAYEQSKVLDNGEDRLKLATEHLGRFGTALAGAEGGAALGAMTGPLAPVAAPVLGLAGGVAGYFAPDAVKWAGDKLGLTNDYEFMTEKANRRIAAQTKDGVRPAAVVAPAAAKPVVEDPYGGIDGVAGTTENGVLNLRNTRPATAENQMFQARANDAGLRAGDLAAGRSFTDNYARRQHELDADQVNVQKAFANKAAAESAAAKGVSDFNDNLRRTGPGLAGGLTAPAQDDELMRAGIAAGGGPMLQAATSLREARDRNATAMQTAQMQADTGLRGQAMQAETARENNAALRAQTAAQMQQTAVFKNLELQRQEREFGLKQQENDERVRKELTDQTNKRIEGMIKPTGDENVDKQRVAQYQAALPAYVEQIKDRLRGELARNPGNRNAASALAGFEARGVGHLGEDELNKFMAGMEFNEKAQEYGSMALNPVGGRAAITRGPAQSIRRVEHPWGNLYVDDATGASVPARAIEKDGSFIGGVRNTRFVPITPITPKKQ